MASTAARRRMRAAVAVCRAADSATLQAATATQNEAVQTATDSRRRTFKTRVKHAQSGAHNRTVEATLTGANGLAAQQRATGGTGWYERYDYATGRYTAGYAPYHANRDKGVSEPKPPAPKPDTRREYDSSALPVHDRNKCKRPSLNGAK